MAQSNAQINGPRKSRYQTAADAREKHICILLLVCVCECCHIPEFSLTLKYFQIFYCLQSGRVRGQLPMGVKKSFTNEELKIISGIPCSLGCGKFAERFRPRHSLAPPPKKVEIARGCPSDSAVVVIMTQ